MRASLVPACAAALVLLPACNTGDVGTYNTAPGAVIESPGDGAHVPWQSSTTLVGTVSDAEDSLDALDVEWSSSLDGVLSAEPASADGATTVLATALSAGQHTITLRVSDSGGLVDRAQIALYVDSPNQPPTAYVTSPANGEVFLLGEGVLMTGSVTDAEDPPVSLYCEWVSSVSGQIDLSVPDSTGHCVHTATDLALGTHELTLRAIDSQGSTGEAVVTFTVRDENAPPELTILAPAQGSSHRHGDAILFEIEARDPDGTHSDLVVEVYDGAVQIASGLHPDTSGYLVWSTDDLDEGDHTVTVYAVDPEDAYTSRAVQFEVRPPNTCPTTPAVAISPSSPRAGDNLSVSLTVPATDVDGDDINYEYLWYRNGAAEPEYALIVPSTDTLRFETWRVEVTASDGDCDSGTAVAQVTIGNTAPSLGSVSLTPSPITESTGATCAASGWNDPDGDTPNYVYEWLVNGAVVGGATSASLDPAYYARGNLVQCAVTPFDGYDYGAELTSAAQVVANTAPGAPVVSIQPASPGDDDDLQAVIVTPATDVDGDALSYRYTWSLDGVAQPGLENLSLVPASSTASGDTWSVSVRAWDGSAEGAAATAAVSVAAGAGLVYVTEVMYDPDAVSESAGEWIEVYNPNAYSVDLDGWVLRDAGGNTHTIAGTVIVPARAYAVLAREADPALNGGVDVDYEYSGFILDNTQDEVLLEAEGILIDGVEYDEATGFPAATGASIGLDPDLGDETTNDEPEAWCPQRSLLAGGDRGTPGAENDDCDCYYADVDGDGFGPCDLDSPDCDDTDEQVHPGAEELCDGVDNDCDGEVDDGLDADFDGYRACGVDADCDDSNPAIHPGATEVCDAYDNDCDGTVNDGAGDAYEGAAFYYHGTIATTASFSMTMHQPTDLDRIRFYVADDGSPSWSIYVQVTGIPAGSDFDLDLHRMADATGETSYGSVDASFNFGNAPETVSVAQDAFTDQSGYYEARVINTGATIACGSYTMIVTVN